ncbi:MAG: hypothetical protein L3J22_03675 [Xanthomonadales bacterium]|nr:hypothetical protein [Xanthomonadales bacterium]
MKRSSLINIIFIKPRQRLAVVCVCALLILSIQPAFATKTLADAVKKAEKNGKTKVISAQTTQKNNKQTHVVRVLTNKGKVKTMRYPVKGGAQKNPKKPRKNKNGG